MQSVKSKIKVKQLEQDVLWLEKIGELRHTASCYTLKDYKNDLIHSSYDLANLYAEPYINVPSKIKALVELSHIMQVLRTFLGSSEDLFAYYNKIVSLLKQKYLDKLSYDELAASISLIGDFNDEHAVPITKDSSYKILIDGNLKYLYIKVNIPNMTCTYKIELSNYNLSSIACSNIKYYCILRIVVLYLLLLGINVTDNYIIAGNDNSLLLNQAITKYLK